MVRQSRRSGLAYTREDLTVLDDSVALIRRHRRQYAGAPPRAARLAAKMVGDLVQFGMTSVSAEAFGPGWLATSQTDWLVVDGVYRAEYWRHIVSAPEIGVEAMRPEVLLTAFSRVLFSVAPQTTKFLVGDTIGNADLRDRVHALLSEEFEARAVGFLIEDG